MNELSAGTKKVAVTERWPQWEVMGTSWLNPMKLLMCILGNWIKRVYVIAIYLSSLYINEWSSELELSPFSKTKKQTKLTKTLIWSKVLKWKAFLYWKMFMDEFFSFCTYILMPFQATKKEWKCAKMLPLRPFPFPLFLVSFFRSFYLLSLSFFSLQSSSFLN